jgi:hypothetical protein
MSDTATCEKASIGQYGWSEHFRKMRQSYSLHICKRVCTSHSVFSTYLGNEPSQKGHDRGVVAKLPNEHYHLFHGHLVARALAQDIIHQTVEVDIYEQKRQTKSEHNKQIPVRSDTSENETFSWVSTLLAPCLLARLRATKTRVIPPKTNEARYSTYRFLKASCSSCWAVSFRRGGAVGAMLSLGDSTGTNRCVLHSKNHREQRLHFDLPLWQGQAKQSRFVEMLGQPPQQHCQGIWRLESPVIILYPCDL